MKKIISTSKAPEPIGPYNQAVQCGNLLYTSGQIPVNPETGTKVEGGIKEQTIQVLENLKAVLAEAGTSLDRAVKTTVFLQDMNEFAEFNGVYAEYFDEETAPARSTVQVAALPIGARVEIELIAELA
ncbi:RidA family protein [Pontiella agarivorans]|uniref:RidA family protein n=1 Tax=Pontiella agarivorans TaxID=3038953 RepID=A0ABU5MTT9_9BACT|nr:RidA family protein [Pontiella agarivorans]MDZ8117588.1 RidA family protein [Pontiella agarivorans]